MGEQYRIDGDPGLEAGAPFLDRAAFAGVRVVELAQYVFVPAGGVILADFGAEVIKIEEPKTGDPYRSLQINDGRQTASANLAMELNNRGKKSLALDLKTAEGREVLLRLIETADIFLTSLRPDAIERLGLGVDALRERNPKIIYVRGNGLGFKGEQANRAGYDASCFWARGGFADVLRPVGWDQPVNARPALGDHAGASNIALAMASALFRRERTGVPSVIDVSLLSTAMWMLSADITVSRVPGYDPTKLTANLTQQPLMRSYRCSDGAWIQLMFLDPDRHWRELCRLTGRMDLHEDARFATVALRAKNGIELYDVLTAVFDTKTAREWGALFAEWDAPWEFVQSISDLADDPQAKANGYLFEVEVEDGTKVEIVSGPMAIDGSSQPIDPRRAPLKGEHSDALLADLGFATSEVDALREQGILA